MLRSNYYILLIISLVLFSACDNLFDYSPYEADVESADRHQTAEAFERLKLPDNALADSFVFVTLSDSHIQFYELGKAVDKINSFSDINFVVHLGDMTDQGLLQEYELTSDIVNGLNVPLFTCIGNHDYLSNGEEIYKRMFGDFNYSIIYQGRKLVFFDATTFESMKEPDMDWLSNELSNSDIPKIVFSHIPPWSDQYEEKNTQKFENAISDNDIILTMFGHQHSYDTGKLLETDTDYIIPGSVDTRKLCKVTVYKDNSYKMQMIPF